MVSCSFGENWLGMSWNGLKLGEEEERAWHTWTAHKRNHSRNVVTGPVTFPEQLLSLVSDGDVSPATFERKEGRRASVQFCPSSKQSAGNVAGTKRPLRNLLQDDKKPLLELCLSWGEMLVVHNHPLVVIPSQHTHRQTHNLKTQLLCSSPVDIKQVFLTRSTMGWVIKHSKLTFHCCSARRFPPTPSRWSPVG